MPTLISDLKPDDLPQVDGFCCGHSYLKLSDARACACLCPQCIGKHMGSSINHVDFFDSPSPFVTILLNNAPPSDMSTWFMNDRYTKMSCHIHMQR